MTEYDQAKIFLEIGPSQIRPVNKMAAILENDCKQFLYRTYHSL